MHYFVSMLEYDLQHYKHNSQSCLHVQNQSSYITVVLRSSDFALLKVTCHPTCVQHSFSLISHRNSMA